ncbi:MAG TPA: hypothetical protein VMV07_23065 [Streptosporangiaceae bacterium]|nr:hypothetical protein [Streptosporangiaceae bacterium]
MKSSVWLLDRVQSDWEVDTLSKALNDRGIAARRVDWATLRPMCDPVGLYAPDHGFDKPLVALVTARVLTRHAEGELALLYDWLDTLERSGVRLINRALPLRRTQNKIVQASLLGAAGIPVPRTRAVKNLEDVAQCLRDWGDVIVKPITGHASIDVIRLLPSPSASAGDSPLGLREDIILWNWFQRHSLLCAQRFIENPGRDLRAVIIGTEVASCHYHISTAPDGSVRSLLHPLRWEKAELTSELESLLLRSVAALELELATVDVLEGPDGYVIIEVNPTVSRWEPIERTSFDLTARGITAAQTDLIAGLVRERGPESK